MPELSLYSEPTFDICAAADDREVPKLLLSRKEAACSLGISVRSLDLCVAAKQIPIRKLGKRILIPSDALALYASIDHDTLTQHASDPVMM